MDSKKVSGGVDLNNERQYDPDSGSDVTLAERDNMAHMEEAGRGEDQGTMSEGVAR